MQWDDMWLKGMMIFGGIGFGGFATLFSRPLFPEAWNEPLLTGAFTLIFIKVAGWMFLLMSNGAVGFWRWLRQVRDRQ
jgi:hypothetical protein